MLSNFQLETHALLQSFLVGQPEFRRTMQSPQMLQLRQRVIAACHIGPLDARRDARLHRASAEVRRLEGRSAVPAGGLRGRSSRPSGAFPGASTRCATGCCCRVTSRASTSSRATTSRWSRARCTTKPSTPSRPPSAGVPPATGRGEAARRRAPAARATPARLQLDAKSADEASRLLAKMQSDPIEERLTRLERRADTIVALLQQLLDAVRPAGRPRSK